MRVLVIGGMQGNEPLGIELVALLNNNSIAGIDTVIANPHAVTQNTRYVESDLNRSFGSLYKGTYETERAKELVMLAKRYDIVLDFHNTQTADNDCGFVGPDAQPTLLDAAKALDVTRCVIAPYDCINRLCRNALSIEISLTSRRNIAQYWHSKLEGMLATSQPSTALKLYRYERRITWQEKNELKLTEWYPFRPLAELDKKRLGVNGIIVPIFIGSRYTEYYATLISLEQET
jgi:hypothetical protein